MKKKICILIPWALVVALTAFVFWERARINRSVLLSFDLIDRLEQVRLKSAFSHYDLVPQIKSKGQRMIVRWTIYEMDPPERDDAYHAAAVRMAEATRNVLGGDARYFGGIEVDAYNGPSGSNDIVSSHQFPVVRNPDMTDGHGF